MLSLKDCQSIITKFLNEPAKVLSMFKQPLSSTPGGFLGDHYNLEIEYEHNGEIKTQCFFMKTKPDGIGGHAEYISTLIRKEALVYANILETFKTYFPNCKLFPNFYLTDKYNYIILENIMKLGYNECSGDMNLQEWEALIQTIAYFHACSIIFEKHNQQPINFIFEDEIAETTFGDNEDHPRFKWEVITSKAIANTLRDIQEPKAANKFLEFLNKKMPTFLKPSSKFSNVINHFDLWKNNAMFTAAENPKLKTCLIYDFQLIRYAPAAFDLLITLHINASSAFLKKNQDRLLGLYYKTLTAALKIYNIDLQIIMSYRRFLESLEEYNKPALVICALYATIIFISKELQNQMASNPEVYYDFSYTNRYKYLKQEIENNPLFKNKYYNILDRIIATFN